MNNSIELTKMQHAQLFALKSAGITSIRFVPCGIILWSGTKRVGCHPYLYEQEEWIKVAKCYNKERYNLNQFIEEQLELEKIK